MSACPAPSCQPPLLPVTGMLSFSEGCPSSCSLFAGSTNIQRSFSGKLGWNNAQERSCVGTPPTVVSMDASGAFKVIVKVSLSSAAFMASFNTTLVNRALHASV